jgi:hypothetical protein
VQLPHGAPTSRGGIYLDSEEMAGSRIMELSLVAQVEVWLCQEPGKLEQ